MVFQKMAFVSKYDSISLASHYISRSGRLYQ